jgi:hypothetical protein
VLRTFLGAQVSRLWLSWYFLRDYELDSFRVFVSPYDKALAATLIALIKKAKGVDLLDDVVETSITSESSSQNGNDDDYGNVCKHQKLSSRKKLGILLRGVL